MRRLLSLAALAAMLASSSAASAGQPSTKWDAWVELGGRFSDHRTLGEAILFAPLMQTHDTLVFADLRGMFDDNDASEGNLGLGIRRMYASGWNLGLYGYFDSRRSSLDNTFRQATFGFEALSRDFDFRVNAYVPLGSRERQIELGSSSVTGYGASQAVLTGANLALQTDIVTTMTSAFLVEKSLAGVDAEIGFRLPAFEIESGLDLRTYVGGYHFAASGMDNVSGPRARLEFAANDLGGWSGVKLTAGLTYQNDDLRGDQFIGHARLRIPLQRTTAPSQPLTYMERRMAETVVRDVDIVSNSRINTVASVTTTGTITEDVINTWNGELVTSVAQVSGTSGQVALQTALDTAGVGGVVVANGVFNATAFTDIGDGKSLIGGGTALLVRGAVSGIELDFAAPGAAGTITGDVPFWVTYLNHRSVIGGMTIHNTGTSESRRGIRSDGTTGAVAFGNHVTTAASNGTSTAIFFTSASQAVIVGNTVDAAGNGFVVRESSNALIRGNAIRSTYFGDSVNVLNSTNVTFQENTFLAGNNGTLLYVAGAGLTSAAVGNIDLSTGTTRCSGTPTTGSVVFTVGPSC